MKKLFYGFLGVAASSYMLLCGLAACNSKGQLTKPAESAIESGLDIVCEEVLPLLVKGINVGDACAGEHAFVQGLLDKISEPAVEAPAQVALLGHTGPKKHAVHRKGRRHPSAWIRGEKLAKQLQDAIRNYEDNLK